MIRIVRLDNSHTDKYTAYLLSRDDSLLYYSLPYQALLEDLLGCQSHYLIALDDEQICGICPIMALETEHGKVYNSLPYYGSNGGVLADNQGVYDKLIEAYNDLASDESTLSMTMTLNPLADQPHTQIIHNYSDHRIGQLTRLTCEKDPRDELMMRFDSSARRNIRKAMRNDITIEVDNSQFDRLRELHQENMQSIGGLPKTDTFFEAIPRHFIADQEYRVYVARKNGIVIAALLLLYFNRTVEYFTPAIDSDYRSDQPLAFIIYEAMVAAAQQGFEWWNWGGTWESQTGVYRFKRKWAAEDRPYHYYIHLKDTRLLNWSRQQLLETFPNFFVLPFSELSESKTEHE